MSKRPVRHVIDLANPPPLTTRQKAQLKALKAMPASDIDTSDIPPLTDVFWRRARRNPLYTPQIVDADRTKSNHT